jgi:predicted enzyme related to lactoylglutathione lyase
MTALGVQVLIPVGNVARSIAFYAGLCGLAVESQSEDFATLRAGEDAVWLHGEDGEVVTAGVEVWLAVADVDAAAECLRSGGALDVRPPSDVDMWGLRVTSGLDPDGRKVWLTTPVR